MRFLVAGLTVLVLSLTVFAQSDDPFGVSDEPDRDPFSDAADDGSSKDPKKTAKTENKTENPLPVRMVLNKKVACDFFEESLEDVLESLERQHNFQIFIDQPRLEDAGIDASDVSLSLELKNISIESLLTLVLGRYDLGFIVRHDDEIVVVTSIEEAEATLTVEVYSVHDMLNKTDPNESADMLIDTIVTAVASETWDELGGPATISHYQGNLVVSQTGDGHRALGDLLTKLRTAIQNAGGPTIPVRPKAIPQPTPVFGGGGNVGASSGGGGGESFRRHHLTHDGRSSRR